MAFSYINFLEEMRCFFDAQQAPHFIVGVSGGLDSVFLLETMRRLGVSLSVAHVNYGFRPLENEQEQQFLTNYCLQHQLPFFCHQSPVRVQLTATGGNLQHEARKDRYAFFQGLKQLHPGSALVLAHHADDQFEGFWLQLSRGGSISGLSGMKKSSQLALRPLLSYRKRQLHQWATEIQLTWHEDSSNAKNTYQRNQWRNLYLPQLERALPTLFESTQVLQRYFQEKQTQLQLQFDELHSHFLNKRSIELSKLVQFTEIELLELFRILEIPLHFSQKISEFNRAKNAAQWQWEDAHMQHFLVKSSHLLTHTCRPISSTIQQQLCIETLTQLPTVFDKSSIYLDAALICGDLRLRPWQAADRMCPIGLNGSKLVADVLKDAGIIGAHKNAIQVLVDAEKIIGIFGICIDRRAIASTSSTQILCVSLSN